MGVLMDCINVHKKTLANLIYVKVNIEEMYKMYFFHNANRMILPCENSKHSSRNTCNNILCKIYYT